MADSNSTDGADWAMEEPEFIAFGAGAAVIAVILIVCTCFMCRRAKEMKNKNSPTAYNTKYNTPLMSPMVRPYSIIPGMVQFQVPGNGTPKSSKTPGDEDDNDGDTEMTATDVQVSNLPRQSKSFESFAISSEELDKDTYATGARGRRDTDSFRRAEKSGLGTLNFGLSYNRAEHVLEVRLDRAQYLAAKNLNNTADPYVKLYLLPGKKPKYVSKVQRNTLNPVFQEQFTFPLREDEVPEKVLKMTVYDYDRFSRRVVLGYVTYPLETLDISEVAGRLTTDTIVEYIKEDSPRSDNNGELLFSLSFNPDTRTLVVNVLKAKDLILPDMEGTVVGVFVKVTLLLDDKAVKTKKTKTQKKSREPIFNEEFVFSASRTAMDHVRIVVMMCSKTGFGLTKLIGKATVGSRLHVVAGPGLDHWQDMLECPKSALAVWHVLK